MTQQASNIHRVCDDAGAGWSVRRCHAKLDVPAGRHQVQELRDRSLTPPTATRDVRPGHAEVLGAPR